MSIADEFRSGNFSLYGQWCGLLSIVCLIVFGIINFSLGWSLMGWIIAFLLIFVEIPLCMKCCPTSQKFDNFMTTFQNSYVRAGGYLVFCILLWVAVGAGHKGVQVVSAIFLTLAALCYGLAAFRGQTPTSSAVTGGTGVTSIV
ncbi:golgi apparatus membrane protein-like protein TVP18 [Mortierella sp. GBAus27b]|nr:Golgi apparatus membrane protein tvp18 [Mortierella sp. GBA43]KAI8356048.1 golgi apparatus membrane protein-like protein TVP18 [Mortierella sp. GBAus27b]